MKGPIRTAREIPTRGSYGLPEETLSRRLVMIFLKWALPNGSRISCMRLLGSGRAPKRAIQDVQEESEVDPRYQQEKI